MKKKVKASSLSERAELYIKELEALRAKHKLGTRQVIVFPNKEKPPVLGKFAGWVIKKLGGRIDTLFIDKK